MTFQDAAENTKAPVPVVIAIIFFTGVSLIGTAIEAESTTALVIGIAIVVWSLYLTFKWLLIREGK